MQEFCAEYAPALSAIAERSRAVIKEDADLEQELAKTRTHVCSNPHCGFSSLNKADLKTCKSCLQAQYCSRECQIAHFKGHKVECKRIKEERVAQQFNEQMHSIDIQEKLNKAMDTAMKEGKACKQITINDNDIMYTKMAPTPEQLAEAKQNPRTDGKRIVKAFSKTAGGMSNVEVSNISYEDGYKKYGVVAGREGAQAIATMQKKEQIQNKLRIKREQLAFAAKVGKSVEHLPNPGGNWEMREPGTSTSTSTSTATSVSSNKKKKNKKKKKKKAEGVVGFEEFDEEAEEQQEADQVREFPRNGYRQNG